MPDGFFIWDFDGRIVDANDAFLRMVFFIEIAILFKSTVIIVSGDEALHGFIEPPRRQKF
jgi:PAS domain-containing protein